MNRTVTVSAGNSRPTYTVLIGPNLFQADEPADFGVNDAAPSPFEFLLAALGTSTSITVRTYADEHHWPLEDLQIWLEHSHVPGKNGGLNHSTTRSERIEKRISLGGKLSEQQRQRLLKIAETCPVHRLLGRGMQINTSVIGANTLIADAVAIRKGRN